MALSVIQWIERRWLSCSAWDAWIMHTLYKCAFFLSRRLQHVQVNICKQYSCIQFLNAFYFVCFVNASVNPKWVLSEFSDLLLSLCCYRSCLNCRVSYNSDFKTWDTLDILKILKCIIILWIHYLAFVWFSHIPLCFFMLHNKHDSPFCNMWVLGTSKYWSLLFVLSGTLFCPFVLPFGFMST